MRTDTQLYWDFTAILSLFDCVNGSWNIDGNLKIQKLTFLYELKGREIDMKSAHYRFFRYTHGPFSKDLANDVNMLKELGFITKQTNQLTRRGKFLIEFLSPFVARSEEGLASRAVLDGVCAEFGRFSGIQLKAKIYKMIVPVIQLNNEMQKVADIDTYTDILDPLREDHLQDVKPFPEEVLAYLKTEFSMPASAVDPENEEVQKSSLAFLESLV